MLFAPFQLGDLRVNRSNLFFCGFAFTGFFAQQSSFRYSWKSTAPEVIEYILFIRHFSFLFDSCRFVVYSIAHMLSDKTDLTTVLKRLSPSDTFAYLMTPIILNGARHTARNNARGKSKSQVTNAVAPASVNHFFVFITHSPFFTSGSLVSLCTVYANLCPIKRT